MCNALVSANIPLTKLKNPIFKNFLEKYSNKKVPDESTLRKKYVNMVFEKTIAEIKGVIGKNHVFFVVDETTDSCGRYIANLLIGVLNENGPGQSYLIATKELERTNNLTVSRFINEALTQFFLPDCVPGEKILLMLSDGATYMIKCANNLRVFYENLIHVTCLAHGISRVAEEIRLHYSNVNSLINAVKKIFIKAPLRVQFYKERLPGTPLPPQPVLTRWGTWIDAALFYADHLEDIKKVVMELSDDSAALRDCKNILRSNTLNQELAFIKSNFACVTTTLTKLETQNVQLVDAVAMVDHFKGEISKTNGPVGDRIREKLNNVLLKNTGFETLTKIASILNGNYEESIAMDASTIAKFKFAPITSVDVERSFSNYKNVLSERRQSFIVENIEKHLIVSIYNAIKNKE